MSINNNEGKKMKRKQIAPYILLVCSLVADTTAKPLEVSYIANEGFLLQSGEKKVLIDALFGEGP